MKNYLDYNNLSDREILDLLNYKDKSILDKLDRARVITLFSNCIKESLTYNYDFFRVRIDCITYEMFKSIEHCVSTDLRKDLLMHGNSLIQEHIEKQDFLQLIKSFGDLVIYENNAKPNIDYISSFEEFFVLISWSNMKISTLLDIYSKSPESIRLKIKNAVNIDLDVVLKKQSQKIAKFLNSKEYFDLSLEKVKNTIVKKEVDLTEKKDIHLNENKDDSKIKELEKALEEKKQEINNLNNKISLDNFIYELDDNDLSIYEVFKNRCLSKNGSNHFIDINSFCEFSKDVDRYICSIFNQGSIYNEQKLKEDFTKILDKFDTKFDLNSNLGYKVLFIKSFLNNGAYLDTVSIFDILHHLEKINLSEDDIDSFKSIAEVEIAFTKANIHQYSKKLPSEDKLNHFSKIISHNQKRIECDNKIFFINKDKEILKNLNSKDCKLIKNTLKDLYISQLENKIGFYVTALAIEDEEVLSKLLNQFASQFSETEAIGILQNCKLNLNNKVKVSLIKKWSIENNKFLAFDYDLCFDKIEEENLTELLQCFENYCSDKAHISANLFVDWAEIKKKEVMNEKSQKAVLIDELTSQMTEIAEKISEGKSKTLKSIEEVNKNNIGMSLAKILDLKKAPDLMIEQDKIEDEDSIPRMGEITPLSKEKLQKLKSVLSNAYQIQQDKPSFSSIEKERLVEIENFKSEIISTFLDSRNKEFNIKSLEEDIKNIDDPFVRGPVFEFFLNKKNEDKKKTDYESKLNKKGESVMEKPNWFKQNLENGLVQGAARVTTNTVATGVAKLVGNAGLDEVSQEIVTKFLMEHKLGKALISMLIGTSVHYAPIEEIQNNKTIQKVADKCAENAVADSAEVFIDVAQSIVLPAIQSALAPATKTSSSLAETLNKVDKFRVVTGDKVEEDLPLEETKEQKTMKV